MKTSLSLIFLLSLVSSCKFFHREVESSQLGNAAFGVQKPFQLVLSEQNKFSIGGFGSPGSISIEAIRMIRPLELEQTSVSAPEFLNPTPFVFDVMFWVAGNDAEQSFLCRGDAAGVAALHPADCLSFAKACTGERNGRLGGTGTTCICPNGTFMIEHFRGARQLKYLCAE